MREITKVIKKREKKIKISLKQENEILTEMCKYLFQLTNASSDMFFYYIKKIQQLEKRGKNES
jgi:hypothetical protein